MPVSTTFGYSATEDRIWMSCAAWPQRIWLTRRVARAVLQAAVHVIETAPPEGDARTPTERAAAEHDASLNRPQPGEHGQALRMGREATDARELSEATLCTQFSLISTGGTQIDLVFRTAAGERRMHLSRTGLHRWLRALHLVMAPAHWHDWTAPPEWLTRSYLPPALQSLLDAPLPPDSGLDEDDAPPGAPAG